MDTKSLEKFAQTARRQLHEQVKAKLEQVLRTDSPELRAKAKVVADLNKEIAQSSRQEVVERVAYTWFNRFCALRYMDANRYTRLGIVSPAPGNSQPEILQEAKAGHIDSDLTEYVDSQRVLDLLSGRLPSADGQAEAYRLLLVGSCNQYNKVMPFLFQKIDDYTELLMPDDLLSSGSVLAAARDVLTEEVCQDVEVIGWLYQFYISEKKDEIDAKVNKGGKVEVDELPAKTTLYTKHWVVRYLVENSLGRLWLLNRPHSKLSEKMAYYVSTGEPDTSFLHVNSPEELTLCDPAVGSGHILTYAFDLLYSIYEEEGYNSTDIPRLILQNNLFGMEIDERAAALAAFALVMKARFNDRRFFRRGVTPKITVISPVAFTESELDTEVAALIPLLTGSWQEKPQQMALLETDKKQLTLTDASGMKALRDALRHDLNLFSEANNFGSLLRPLLNVSQLTLLHDHLSANAPTGQLQIFDQQRRQKVVRAIAQAISLARLYTVVVANPPYLGKSMNTQLNQFAKKDYPDSKGDLFAMFIERGLELTFPKGYNAMVAMESWMFLSSYEDLRNKLLAKSTINCMVHMPYLGKGGTPMGINFGTAATVFKNQLQENFKGHFTYVRYYETNEDFIPYEFPVQNERLATADTADFKKIPGSPIAYWIGKSARTAFDEGKKLSQYAEPRLGMATGNNAEYLRLWQEVSQIHTGIDIESRVAAKQSRKKWFPYNKGGDFRRWYGNNEYVVDWWNDGYRLQTTLHPSGKRIWAHNFNLDYIFKPSITWTFVSSFAFGIRQSPSGFLFDVGGSSAFPSKDDLNIITGFLGSKLSLLFLKALNPTMNFQPGNVGDLPIVELENDRDREKVESIVNQLVSQSKKDWDSYETSWDFSTLPLLKTGQPHTSLVAAYAILCQQWQIATLKMQQLEEENNRLFIAAYGLHDELSPDVPLSEITLTCNPYYRYNANKTEAELDTLLLADTMREFISYAVGCMFGRYSLDKPGLILANQGETLADYLQNVFGDPSFSPHPTAFLPDADNAIPMLDGDWFPDDITERFKKFLRITFGEEHYAENLAFIESALGRDIRNYFLREFYDHHVKMYKKRPIYWLFSSAKGSFNVLIYMHRYKPDTVSVVLNDYLREFRAKLTARKNHLESVSVSAASSASDKTRALKEISDIDKTLKEIREYEDDVLYPLATRQVQIDLDDGVLVNYNKFGKALKKITGLTQQ